MREGDFGGYIAAGKLARNHNYIYSDFRNTWPPFFSLFSIPLYLANELSFVGLRLVWLLGICVAYIQIFAWIISLFGENKLVFKLQSSSPNHVSLTHPLFLVPFLLTFRIFLEEVSNLQINVFILFISILVLKLILENRYFLAGLLLAIIISIKVYPLLILGFFVFKKKWAVVVSTFIGLAVCTLSVALYFGFNETYILYQNWINQQVVYGMHCTHLNQSIWGLTCGLFTENQRIEGLSLNLLNLSISQAKILTISILSILGAIIGFSFYRKRNSPISLQIQYLIVLSLIPVLSPLAWKYYFVFIAPLCIYLSHRMDKGIGKSTVILSFAIITFTSELFIGNRLSDITEAYGFITLCSLLITLLSLNYQTIKQ